MNELEFQDFRGLHADIYVDDVLAATIRRTPQGTEFQYVSSYRKHHERPIATSLPLSTGTILRPGGSVPAFFAGLLPEGRRLSALKRAIKTSADDELSQLLAVGSDTVGNISVVPEGTEPRAVPATIECTEGDSLDFSPLLQRVGVFDRKALAGVQDKASARVITIPATLNTGVNGTEALIKISPADFPQVVENEHACIELFRPFGRKVGLSVVEASILTDIHGTPGLCIVRFDRDGLVRYPVEDATQLMGLYPGDKYRPSMEEVALALAGVCASPKLALRGVAAQVAFAWLIGNGDLHAKNISVIDRGRGFELSPVYDIPSTVPYGDTSMALSVGGSTTGLSKKRFVQFCEDIGLPERVAHTITGLALAATDGAAEFIIARTGWTDRKARDLSRVLKARRKHWS